MVFSGEVFIPEISAWLSSTSLKVEFCTPEFVPCRLSVMRMRIQKGSLSDLGTAAIKLAWSMRLFLFSLLKPYSSAVMMILETSDATA